MANTTVRQFLASAIAMGRRFLPTWVSITCSIGALGIVLIGGLLAVDCGHASTPSGPSSAPVATLFVINPYLAPGDTDQCQALAFDSRNQPIDLTAEAQWASLDPSIVSIDITGHARGISAGTATIRATARGATGTAPLTVVAPSDLYLFFSGNSQRVLNAPGEVSGLQLFAGGMILAGNTFDVTNRSTWTSSNPQRVRIDGPARATALQAGFADVIATYHGLDAREGVLLLPTTVASANSLSLPEFSGNLSGFVVVGGRITASNDVSYTLVSTDTARLAYRIVNQDLQIIGNNPSIEIRSGSGTIHMSDSFVIPPGTLAICWSATLFAEPAEPLTAFLPFCRDLTRQASQ